MIDLEDPYYYMNVDGQRLKLESVKHLRQQRFIPGVLYGPIKI